MHLMGCSSIREELVYEKPNVFQDGDGLTCQFDDPYHLIVPANHPNVSYNRLRPHGPTTTNRNQSTKDIRPMTIKNATLQNT